MANFITRSGRYLGGFFGGRTTRINDGDQIVAPSSRPIDLNLSVNEDSALQVGAVYSCISLLANTVASLPIEILDLSDDDKKRVKDGDLYRLLTRKPNAIQTAYTLKQTLMLNYCLHGNGYGWIARNNRGKAVAISPIPSQCVTPRVLSDGATLIYEYEDELNDRTVIIAPEQMIHIRGMGNGIAGMNTLSYAANTIGAEIAAQKLGIGFFKNSGKPSGVLTVDNLFTKDQREQVRENIVRPMIENDHSTLVLEAAMKYQQISLDPQQMQMLETRQYNVEDIARYYGVPSILINDNTNTTSWGTGIEQIIIGWLNTTLNPLLRNIEESFACKVFGPAEVNRMCLRFDVSQLLSADTKSKAEFLRSMITSGVMTPNEAREKLDLDKHPEGDKLYMQGAMVPIDQAGQQLAPQTENDPEIEQEES